jgi:hypothetical protein
MPLVQTAAISASVRFAALFDRSIRLSRQGVLLLAVIKTKSCLTSNAANVPKERSRGDRGAILALPFCGFWAMDVPPRDKV